jgi:hypothetical protein
MAVDFGQTLLVRERNRLCPAVNAELLQDPLDVAADGLGADEEVLGDLRLGEATGEKLQHLALATRQRLRSSSVFGALRTRASSSPSSKGLTT